MRNTTSQIQVDLWGIPQRVSVEKEQYQKWKQIPSSIRAKVLGKAHRLYLTGIDPKRFSEAADAASEIRGLLLARKGLNLSAAEVETLKELMKFLVEKITI